MEDAKTAICELTRLLKIKN